MVEVSVIIPAFNAEKTLGRCLDSVLSQALELEVIVIDDCSTDGTVALCKRYVDRDERVRLLRNSQNIGQGLSRNRGIEVAFGTFLAFVDADDYLAPHMYEDLLSLMRAGNLHIDVAGCALLYPAPNALRGGVPRLEGIRYYDRAQIHDEVLPALMGNPPETAAKPRAFPISSCTYLFRTSLVRQHGIAFLSERLVYSEDLFFDYDVMRHAAGFAFTVSPYYCYTVNAGSAVHRYHDPTTKIERLYALAGTDEKLLQRASLTTVNALIETTMQLCMDVAFPWAEKHARLAALFDNPLVKRSLATYPLRMFTIRKRIFFACCTPCRATIALMMAFVQTCTLSKVKRTTARLYNKFIRSRSQRASHGLQRRPHSAQVQETNTEVRP